LAGRTEIFTQKVAAHGKTLTSGLSLELKDEALVLQRRGGGQRMKIQAKDCHEGGIFQMEPESSNDIYCARGSSCAPAKTLSSASASARCSTGSPRARRCRASARAHAVYIALRGSQPPFGHGGPTVVGSARAQTTARC
jgi:hypothetical protein